VQERSVVSRLPAICGFGRYELLGRLAVGGMAEIYLAREPSAVQGAGHRTVVIKRVLPHVADDPEFVQMFFDEARLAMRLHHPSIVHIYEFGEQDDSYFLAMEWVDGVALSKIIRTARESGGVPPPVAAKVLANVAEALHYAHHLRDDDGRPLNIVHRDVSPQNVMVSFDGATKLLDFGIAKATLSHAKTGDGQVKGKFAYMSPQQCMGEAVDGRADVFALGVVLWETLTGQPLYHRKTQYETMRAVIEDPVPRLLEHAPQVGQAMAEIVERALAKDPDERFPTAGDMQIALERWLAVHHEVVPATRIGGYLQELFGRDFGRGPLVDSTPFGSSYEQKASEPPVAVSEPPKLDSVLVSPQPQNLESLEITLDDEEERKTSVLPILAIVAALLLLLGAGGVAWWLMQGDGEVAEATPPPAPVVPVETAPPSPMVVTPVTERIAAPVTGGARITSEPTGAEVTLDGEPRGTTPLALGDLEPGTFEVEVSLSEHRTWRGELVVAAGETVTLEAPLRRRSSGRPAMREVVERPEMAEMTEEVAGSGTLSVNTRPWSRVYLGARQLGTTPIGRASVPAGAVQLRLVDRDGNEHRRTVQVAPGAHERAFFDLSGHR